MTKIFCLFAISGFLFACSPKQEDTPKTILTASQQKALDQAKQTEQILKDENERRLKEVDEGEASSDADSKK